MVKEMTRSINMGPSMSEKFHIREVSYWAISHGLNKPNELTQTINTSNEIGHRWGDTVGDIDYAATITEHPNLWIKIDWFFHVLSVGWREEEEDDG